jgi:hypothetical protein
MSGFAGDWLALREPADAGARSLSVTRTASAALPHGIVRAVDLATGTGANVRYLAPHLGPEQDWLLVDADEGLLDELPARMQEFGLPPGVRIHCRRVDLSDLEGTDIVDGRTLVTASALLDLVSEPWVASLAASCRRAGAVVLFALTYNGRIAFSPVEPADDIIRRLVNEHQHTDKGFGLALGPDASLRAARHFAGLGYEVTRAPSEWMLAAPERALQEKLIDGWAEAATAVEPGKRQLIAEWHARRQGHVTAGRSHIVVGHYDLVAIP